MKTYIENESNNYTIEKDKFIKCSEEYVGRFIIPDKVKSIGKNAFRGCSQLVEIIIPDSVIEIEEYAFLGCVSLENVTIPNSVRSIGRAAFKDCRTLDRIELPPTITEISMSVFENCTALKSVEIPNSIKVIGTYAFKKCINLMECELPNSLVEIGNESFSGCWNISSIDLPDSVEIIEEGAFQGCDSIREFYLPQSIKEIKGNILTNCGNLAKIFVDRNNKVYDSRENCNAIIRTEDNILFCGCRNTIIPNSVAGINDRAFGGSSIQNITIPDSIRWIGYQAFRNCTLLQNVVVPISVDVIHGEAFYGCVNLLNIELPGTRTGNAVFMSIPFLNVHYRFENPERLNVMSFDKRYIGDYKLYVPVGTGYSYRHNPNTAMFKEIIIERVVKFT